MQLTQYVHCNQPAIASSASADTAVISVLVIAQPKPLDQKSKGIHVDFKLHQGEDSPLKDTNYQRVPQ